MNLFSVSTVSFPGLGIEPFEVNDTAFNLFGREVKWYGVIICFGMILAVLYFYLRGRKRGINFDTVVDYAIVTIPVGVIGARLYYCVFYHTPIQDIYKIWEGGLAIYGGIIFGVLAVLCVSHFKKQSVFTLLDLIVPGVMIAQTCGRWGNFMNGEAFGSATDIFIRMGLKNYRTGYVMTYVHPTFLYESLWNLIGFTLINIFYKKKKFEGEIFFWYVAWYGLGRTFIEMLRTDSLYIGQLRVSSLLAAICFVVSVPLCIFFRAKRKKLIAAGTIAEDDYCYISTLLGIKKKVKEVVVEETVEKQETPVIQEENSTKESESDGNNN
ncbi:MAG: prolipoprotein diacylglyceryl transferase [Clostridia bacterium]|nr:prolipoprotein diacylglyceryl transferase [Clostridia bacterium]